MCWLKMLFQNLKSLSISVEKFLKNEYTDIENIVFSTQGSRVFNCQNVKEIVMSLSKALSALSDMIVQHQREFDSFARMFQMKDSLSSSSFFSDGVSNSTYKVQRENNKLTIVSTKNNVSLTVVVPLPLTSDSRVEVTSVNAEGVSTTKAMSFSEYLKGFEVPAEVKELYSKVVKAVSSLFPTLAEGPDREVEPAKQEVAATADSATGVTSQETTTEQTAVVEAVEPFKEYTLYRTDAKYLKFEGKLLYSAATPLVTGRNKEFYLFQSKGGKFVVQEKKKSVWPGEHLISEVVILQDKDAVIRELYARGKNRLVQDVVSRLNWLDDYVESID